jgi:hypothetical protein
MSSSLLRSASGEIELRVTTPEFLSALRSECDVAKPVEVHLPGIEFGKPFICSIDGRKFVIKRRVKYGKNDFARVLYGEIVDVGRGPVLRYRLSIPRPVKVFTAILTVLIVLPMLYLALFFLPDNIDKAHELGYRICAILLALSALPFTGLLVKLGAWLGRNDEQELIDLIKKITGDPE